MDTTRYAHTHTRLADDRPRLSPNTRRILELSHRAGAVSRTRSRRPPSPRPHSWRCAGLRLLSGSPNRRVTRKARVRTPAPVARASLPTNCLANSNK